ncbi:thioredoxin family protein [Sphingomonas azotifigens]|uniref:thioredoxin family protein n=1 Tax=Sphingomonas azotifigens TaxID=330920 RepID=UPI001431721C|nr:thioredoxin family protein [Sphingomonas azotifigens]
MTASPIVIEDDHLAPLDAAAGERLQMLVFSATWCGPCTAMAPVIEDIARSYAGEVAVAKIDIERSPEIVKAFDVRAVPTLVLRRGAEIDRHVGALTRTRLALMLDAALESGSASA